MFKSIIESWHKARGGNLRDEFADMMDHFNSYMTSAPNGLENVENAAQKCYKNFTKQFGNLTDLTDNQKKSIAKEMSSMSRKVYRTNFGAAIGFSFVGMWLESMALPGEDASRVKQLSSEMLEKLGVL